MKKQIIYLSGAINDVSLKTAQLWRKKIMLALKGKYTFINPLDYFYNGDYRTTVNNDKRAIGASDIMIVNLNDCGWGTAMEVHLAYILNVKILGITNKKNVKENPWIKCHVPIIYNDVNELILNLEDD